jgi:hypothetical protein
LSSFVLFCLGLGLGFLLGAVYDIVYFLKLTVKNNFIVSNILNFVYVCFYGLVVLGSVINFNYGQFRLFLVLSFVLGTLLHRKTLGKIFAKIFLCLYNKLCKGLKTLTKTKLVKKVLK